MEMTQPSCPQCGTGLRTVCFLCERSNGYFCPACRSFLDTSLRPLIRPPSAFAEVVDSQMSAMKPETSETSHGSPSLSTSKPAGLTVDALRERLAGWLQFLQITDGLDDFSVKPRDHLGYQTWGSVNNEVRSLGGYWVPRWQSWRIKK
jgi:transcription elongation factor Elf1